MGNVIGMLVQVRREAPGESARSEIRDIQGRAHAKGSSDGVLVSVQKQKSVFRRFNFKSCDLEEL